MMQTKNPLTTRRTGRYNPPKHLALKEKPLPHGRIVVGWKKSRDQIFCLLRKLVKGDFVKIETSNKIYSLAQVVSVNRELLEVEICTSVWKLSGFDRMIFKIDQIPCKRIVLLMRRVKR